MIELPLTEFFELLLAGIAILAGLGVLWDRVHERNAARAVRRRTVRCRICAAAYRRDRQQAGIQACPECGHSNCSGRDRRLG